MEKVFRVTEPMHQLKFTRCCTMTVTDVQWSYGMTHTWSAPYMRRGREVSVRSSALMAGQAGPMTAAVVATLAGDASPRAPPR